MIILRKEILISRASGRSLLFRAIAVSFSLILLSSVKILSQSVINNNGAVINVKSGTVVSSQHAVNSAGALSNSGTINLSGNYTNSVGSLSNDGLINMAGNLSNTATIFGNTGTFRIGGNWTNAGVFSALSSTVIFNGLANQTITRAGGEIFNNLSVENTGATGLNYIGLSNNVNVTGILSMARGHINAGANRLLLSNPVPSALNYTSTSRSRILGKFERGVNQPGTYLFPLGTTAHFNPANLITNNVNSAGTVLSEFFTPPSIDDTGLPFPDPPDEVDRVWQNGYWLLTSAGGFTSSSYNINLKAAGFSTYNIQDITRVIKRTVGSPGWVADGAHSPATPGDSVVYRNNLSGGISATGTQFALGQSRPRIIKHPRDTAACEISDVEFEVRATSTRTLTYTWYKEPAIPLVGPRYVTPGPGILIIRNLILSDAGLYYCIVTDDYGNSTRSNSATLIVNMRPQATATPSSQDHECSNVAFDNMVLGEVKGVPGSYYLWSRNNPAGITSLFPMTGTVPNIGDFIPAGTFTNTTDAPITVTFTIIPYGPAPTLCEGPAINAYITVNPTPRIVPVNAKPQICYGGTTDITLTTPSVMTMGVIRFDYTVSVTAGVTGTTPPATAPGINIIPGQKLTFGYLNSTDDLQSVFYSITPKVVGLSCPNGVIEIPEVKVHALPLQGITVVKQLTCSGGSDGTLRADQSKGASPYQVQWFGPGGYTSNQALITNLKRGFYQVTVRDNLACSNTSSIEVSGAYLSTLIEVTAPVSCPGGSDGTVRIKVDNTSTGTAPFTYWIVRNGQDTINPSGSTLLATEVYNSHTMLNAADYSLHLMDSKGCYDDTYPEVTMPQPQVIKMTFTKSVYTGGFNISCKGYNDGWAQASVTGGNPGGYTYLWTTTDGSIPGPANTSRIDNITAGTYYLEVRDSKNCPMYDSVKIIEPAGMVLSGSQVSVSKNGDFNISCNGGNDGFIKLTIAGGSGSYLYSWTGPGSFSATTKDISNLIEGTYTATITDQSNASCILMPKPTFTLTDPDPLGVVPTRSLSAEGSHNINCSGGTGAITLAVSGGSLGNYRYNWTTTNGSGIVQGQKDQNALTAGTYNVVVTDSNLCVTSASATLTQPSPLVITLVPTHITCQSPGFNNGSVNLTVSGGVGPYIYNWTNGATTEDISNLTTGNYMVRVTDVNGCWKEDNVTVNLPPPIAYTSILSNYNGLNVSCYGLSDGSIQINTTSGDPPYTYSWQGPDGFASSDQSISGLKAGQYQLLITDMNACTATGTFNITEPGKLYMNLAISQSTDGNYNINCAGSSTGSINVNPVNNVGGVVYLWSDGYTDKTRIALAAGSYKVIILDLNNCNADTLINITEPSPIGLSFDVKQAFCPDSPDGEITVTATGGVVSGDYTYRWSNGSTSPTISNILKGIYKVVVTDANNCSARDSVNMQPQNETCLVVPNAFSPNDDNINDVWNIGMRQLYPQMEIKVFNRWGEEIWRSAKGYPDPWDGRRNGALLPIDSYHYIIDLHNGSKPVVGTITIVR